MLYKNALVNGECIDILVEDGKIARIGSIEGEGFDFCGKKVYPGLIDVHSHGCMGYDTMDGSHLEPMSVFMAENGVTSWLPTTMTMDMDTIRSVVNADLSGMKGATVLGFHMEGPYISQKFKGAQNEKYIKNPDINEYHTLKNIRIVTIAPELDGSSEFIKQCGCVVSLGHTDADYDCAADAFDNGANCLTHTFNAMPALHHRNPGPIGAAVTKNAYVQVICDGLHIHQSVINMLYRTFGTERMVLISDSMRATGLCDGEYEFGGQTITVKNGVARTPDGAIAGSTSTLLQCVKKAIEFGIDEMDAFKMASETPADMLGLNKGRIEVGFDADFIVINENYNIEHTVINGEIV